MNWQTIKQFFRKRNKPELSVPAATPLSPCIIEPYTNVKGVKEENKGYIPVSLLIRAIDDDRMLNIAVAGNYGVGKSSIINTAEKKLKKRLFHKHRFIRISLASLLTQENKLKERDIEVMDEKGNGLSPSVEAGVTDRQIEYSILQQILYHDRPQKTPKSRIRRIHKTRREKPYVIAAIAMLLFVSLLLLIQPSWFHLSDYFDIENATKCVKSIIKWGPLVVLGVVFIVACRYVSRHYSFSLARVGYKDIEMKVKEDMSIFNAFMDEIVYFFESTKYDVVVFEDLDRFENREVIFYKLRELNTILNNSRSIRRRINFVYAVLDDLFDSTERVKFFDYIITVIPVINSLNSYEQLMEYIKPAELFEKLGRNELRNLCDYFQDMRLLLNIVNEFNQFVPLLDTAVMSEKILFGLIVYKNYVPSDFSRMYNKAGVVADVIESADKFRQDIVEDKLLTIEELQKKIKGKQDDFSNEVVKLRKSILDTGRLLSSYTNTNLKIRIDGEAYLFEVVANNSALFEKVRKEEANYLINNGTLVHMPSFSSVEGNMGGSGYYTNKISSLKSDCENQIAVFEQRIQSIQKEIESLPTTVHGIYQASPEFLDEALNPLRDDTHIKLVKFLILNGYLDRHYQYYISYFYPNALNREDRNFVMRAGRHEGVQHDVKLERIDEVLKRFTPQDVETNASLLNVDLVREIYRNPHYDSYCFSVCKQITSSKNLDFILLAYQSSPPFKNAFFYQLLRLYDYWEEISAYDQSKQDDLREVYVKFCEVRQINPSFQDWLANNYAFLDMRWDTISPKRLIDNVFKTYTPIFNVLRLKNTPDAVLFDIIENQRYEFTRQTFSAIVRKLGFYDKYSMGAYTALREANYQPLLRIVEKNWSKAIKSVFPDTSIREENSALTAMLNSPTIPRAEIRSYIGKQRSRIQFASPLRDEVLTFAFENSLVEASWTNVYFYAVQTRKGLPLSFLYNNTFHGKVRDDLSAQEENDLCRLVVFSNDVKQSKYEELVPLFTTPFQKVLNPVFPARMNFLVNNNFLVFSEENYKFVKERYPALSSTFLAKNVCEYMLSPDKYSVSNADAVAALKAIETKKSKCDFIRAIANEGFYPDSELISVVKPFLMNGDLKASEIGFRLLNAIIANDDTEDRIKLGRRAILSLPYDKDKTTALLKSMGDEYQRLTSDSSVSTIPYSRDAILIVNELVKNGHFKDCEKKGSTIVIQKR